MITISRSVAIAEDEISLSGIRAQGAGGQHVNKSSTAIHLRFDIKASSLPDYYKERLLTASHHLISAEGVVIIKAQEYRSQEMNREAAIARLVALIQELTAVQKSRRETRPTRASKSADWLQRRKNPQLKRCVERFASKNMANRWNG